VAAHAPREGQLRLDIRDDGRGAGGELRFGNGLTGMRERLQAVGGGVEAQGGAQRGVRLRAWLPLALPERGAGMNTRAERPVIRLALADDQALVRSGLRALLDGFAQLQVVVEAGDGEALLAALAAQPVDVVLSDIRMPGLDGFGLLEALRARSAVRAPPVILLTTFDEPELALRAAAARRARFPAQGRLARGPARSDHARGRRRNPAGAGVHRPGARALRLPRPVRAFRHLQRARSGDPAPARRRLLQQGGGTRGVPVRRHGEELRLRHPRQARHARPHARGAESDYAAHHLMPAAKFMSTPDFMPGPDFIEVYEGALTPGQCDSIVARFEASGQDLPGRVGGGVMPELKDSRDIAISGKAEWRDVEAQLNTAMLAGLLRYLRRYRYALLAPLMLHIADADTGQARRMVEADFDALDDGRLAEIVQGVFRPGPINLQRYRADAAAIPTGIASCTPRTPAPRPCTAACCGRCTSTRASRPARRSFTTSNGWSGRRQARC
jgi:CheY-like chemotaxis protein